MDEKKSTLTTTSKKLQIKKDTLRQLGNTTDSKAPWYTQPCTQTGVCTQSTTGTKCC